MRINGTKSFATVLKTELNWEDKGISGAKVDEDGLTVEREGLRFMLADLASIAVDFVVVLNTSRLWRSDMVKVLIQRELNRHRLDVRAIEQQTYSIYNYDPNDFLVNGMLELLDQYQRLEIALKMLIADHPMEKDRLIKYGRMQKTLMEKYTTQIQEKN